MIAEGARRGGRGYRCGFALLEVLVAFTIFALVFGVLLQVFAGGVRAARSGEQYTRATLLAQSKLADLGVQEDLAEGTREGRFDPVFGWRVTVSPYPWGNPDEESVRGPRGPPPVRALLATVEVLWEDAGRRRSVALSTIELESRSR